MSQARVAKQGGKLDKSSIAAHAVRRVVYIPNHPFTLPNAIQRDTPYVQPEKIATVLTSNLIDDVWKWYNH